MAGISSPGIGSGLDVNSIVSGLVDAERTVFDKRYEANNLVLTEKISAFGAIKSSLSEFSDVLFDLKLTTTFSKRKVDYSDTNFELEVGSAAQAGNFSVDVLQVAANHKITSASFGSAEAIGEGDITIAVGTSSFDFELDSAATLDDLRDLINSDASASAMISASVINGDDGSYLVLESKVPGEENTISVTTTDIDGNEFDDSGLSRLSYNPKQFVLDNTFATGEVLGQAGSITLNNGSESQTLAIGATDTIEDIVTNINALGLNLTATLEDDGAGNNKLVIESANDYGDHTVSVVIDTDGDGNLTDASGVSKLAFAGDAYNYGENTAASDAEILVNGSITATSSSNEFSGVLDGVIINAKSVTTATQNVEVSLDKESMSEQINLLVEKFNAVISKIDEYAKVDTVEQTTGVLTGDSTIRQIIGRIRNQFSRPVTLSDDTTLSMSQLGITTNRDGSISVDTTKLSEEIETNFESFSDFFAGDDGLASGLYDTVNEYDKFQGLIDKRIDGFRILGEQYDEEKASFDSKMDSYETRLYAQFLAMDTIVAQLNSTGDFLDQQLKNLPGSSKND